MSACSFVRDPVWDAFINFKLEVAVETHGDIHIHKSILSSSSLHLKYSISMSAFRLMFHMHKPDNVPVYAIWRVWIYNRVNDIGLRAFIEVLLDHSSSWYTWDNPFGGSDLYMTFNKAVNILLESNSVGIHGIVFTRDVHDGRITKYITGKTLQQFNFSFHNQR